MKKPSALEMDISRSSKSGESARRISTRKMTRGADLPERASEKKSDRADGEPSLRKRSLAKKRTTGSKKSNKTMRRVLPSDLSAQQKVALRRHSHHLQAVLHMGKDGVSDGLLQAVSDALHTHEVIKLKLLETAPGDRHELAQTLAEKLDACLLQVLGRMAVLYRPRPASDPRPSVLWELG
mgnify:CR=1 FL=1